MIFSAWVIRSGPASTARGTTWQRVKVGMASSHSWSSLGGSVACCPLSRWRVHRPLKDENPALTHHANFTACDYNISICQRKPHASWVASVASCVKSLVTTESVRWGDTTTRNSCTLCALGKPLILSRLPCASSAAVVTAQPGEAA